MIKPNPYKYKCPKCGYSKTVRPKSDALNIVDYIDTCPKCGTGMERKELDPISKFIENIFYR